MEDHLPHPASLQRGHLTSLPPARRASDLTHQCARAPLPAWRLQPQALAQGGHGCLHHVPPITSTPRWPVSVRQAWENPCCSQRYLQGLEGSTHTVLKKVAEWRDKPPCAAGFSEPLAGVPTPSFIFGSHPTSPGTQCPVHHGLWRSGCPKRRPFNTETGNPLGWTAEFLLFLVLVPRNILLIRRWPTSWLFS